MPPAYELKETLLKIDNVCLSFDGKVVLRDVNAEIRDIVRDNCTTGQVVGFLGPSGIGKTQLFRIIAGLNQPTSGRVLVNFSLTPVKAGVGGVVGPNYPLFEDRTIFSNLILAGRERARAGYNRQGRTPVEPRRAPEMVCAQL